MVENLALLGAGIGIGWIACHYTTVRHLMWTIRDMRKERFVYDAPMDHEELPHPAYDRVNET